MSASELIEAVGIKKSREWYTDWGAVTEALGVPLPADYRMLVEWLGPGCLGGFFWILVPRYHNPWINLELSIEEFRASFSAMREEFASFRDVRIFPEESGLLPWGRTDNGNYLLYRCVGGGDAWTIVIYEARGPRFEEYKMSASELILSILTGALTVSTLPNDLDGCLTFDPLE